MRKLRSEGLFFRDLSLYAFNFERCGDGAIVPVIVYGAIVLSCSDKGSCFA